ncbi:hypothetical protein BF95_19870 [Sphingobium sp. Ant17]|nr:hypothetical protein BF95_19870 [Sphingobium sp. Ant17]
MEDILDRVELAVAGPGDAEMRTHQRRDFLQGFLGIAAAQHVGDLEAQGDARLPPRDIPEQPFEPCRPKRQQQDQDRDRTDQHGEIGLPQIAATAGHGHAGVGGEDRRAHADIMHAGDRHTHDSGSDQPMRQLMIASSEPHRGGGRTNSDQDGKQEPRAIIAERRCHMHRCHAQIVHPQHTRADQKPRRHHPHRGYGRPAHHPKSSPGERQGQHQRQ